MSDSNNDRLARPESTVESAIFRNKDLATKTTNDTPQQVFCRSQIEAVCQGKSVRATTRLQRSQIQNHSGNVPCESTVGSANRRDFIRKAAAITAAAGIGGILAGQHTSIPYSLASSATKFTCVEVCCETVNSRLYAAKVWVDSCGKNQGRLCCCGGISPGAIALGAGVGAGTSFRIQTGIASNQCKSEANYLGIDFYTDKTKHLSITQSGNVGIGTCHPCYSLHLPLCKTLRICSGKSCNAANFFSFGGGGSFGIDAPGVANGRFVVKNTGNVGIGVPNPGAKLEASGTVLFTNKGSSSPTLSVANHCGTCAAVSGVSILSNSCGPCRPGQSTGVFGSSGSGTGVVGCSQYGTGVHGSSSCGSGVSGCSLASIGVLGTGKIAGIRGASKCGSGIFGCSTASGQSGVYGAGVTYGVTGVSCSGTGVWGDSPKGTGVKGSSKGSNGVFGCSTAANGVFGCSTACGKSGLYGKGVTFGVTGLGCKGQGVVGASKGSHGVFGCSSASGHSGVYGIGPAYGVTGATTCGIGVWGDSCKGAGVKGTSKGSNGVTGCSTASCASGVYGHGITWGVAGHSASGTGVWGSSPCNVGVVGTGRKYGVHGCTGSLAGAGVWGSSSCSIGVMGSGKKYGVQGCSGSGVGVIGSSSGAYAVPLVARGAAGQRANLQNWENSCGTALSGVNTFGWLGLGTICPNATLTVYGSVSTKFVQVTKSYTMCFEDFGVLVKECPNVTSGCIEISLPVAGGAPGQMVFVKNATCHAITVSPRNCNSIEGLYTPSSPISLGKKNDSLTLISDGSSEWYVVSGVKCAKVFS